LLHPDAIILDKPGSKDRPYEPAVSQKKRENREYGYKTGNELYSLVAKDVCEGCHMSGKSSIPQALTVTPHQNGGAYCLSCHVISHQEHPMSDRGVMCEDCHGKKNTPENQFISTGAFHQ